MAYQSNIPIIYGPPSPVRVIQNTEPKVSQCTLLPQKLPFLETKKKKENSWLCLESRVLLRVPRLCLHASLDDIFLVPFYFMSKAGRFPGDAEFRAKKVLEYQSKYLKPDSHPFSRVLARSLGGLDGAQGWHPGLSSVLGS